MNNRAQVCIPPPPPLHTHTYPSHITGKNQSHKEAEKSHRIIIPSSLASLHDLRILTWGLLLLFSVCKRQSASRIRGTLEMCWQGILLRGGGVATVTGVVWLRNEDLKNYVVSVCLVTVSALGRFRMLGWGGARFRILGG